MVFQITLCSYDLHIAQDPLLEVLSLTITYCNSSLERKRLLFVHHYILYLFVKRKGSWSIRGILAVDPAAAYYLQSQRTIAKQSKVTIAKPTHNAIPTRVDGSKRTLLLRTTSTTPVWGRNVQKTNPDNIVRIFTLTDWERRRRTSEPFCPAHEALWSHITWASPRVSSVEAAYAHM
jgi:hypothetical protein